MEWTPPHPLLVSSNFVRQDQNAAVVRRLSALQWDYVLETAEHLAHENPNEHERTLFILAALYAMYLRISELVADERSAPVMGDFRKDGDGHWWFHVTGKGNKDRAVSVSDAMLRALKRYRCSLKLSKLPLPGDTLLLVANQRGRGSVTSSRHIRWLCRSHGRFILTLARVERVHVIRSEAPNTQDPPNRMMLFNRCRIINSDSERKAIFDHACNQFRPLASKNLTARVALFLAGNIGFGGTEAVARAFERQGFAGAITCRQPLTLRVDIAGI